MKKGPKERKYSFGVSVRSTWAAFRLTVCSRFLAAVKAWRVNKRFESVLSDIDNWVFTEEVKDD